MQQGSAFKCHPCHEHSCPAEFLAADRVVIMLLASLDTALAALDVSPLFKIGGRLVELVLPLFA